MTSFREAVSFHSRVGAGLVRCGVVFSALVLFAVGLQAQDPGAEAAAQAAQQSTQLATQAAQQANDAMVRASQQANTDAQQAMANAASTGPFPRCPGYGRADKPSFYPRSGKVPAGTPVSISDATPKASIFYTLDGSEPTTSSTQYAAPILMNATSRLRAIARSPIYSASRVASAKYVVK